VGSTANARSDIISPRAAGPRRRTLFSLSRRAAVKYLPILALNARTGRSPTAIGLGRFVAAPLYGIKSNDPAIAALSIAMLAAAAAPAGLIPARRASRIDPMACPPLRLRSGIAAGIYISE
jgi:hypothetical protein